MNIKKSYLKSFFITYLLLLSLLPNTSNAGLFLKDELKNTVEQETDLISSPAGFNIDVAKTPEAIIAEIIKIALGFLGVIFIILTIYAGFLWMTAMGESDKIGTAKEIFISSITGLVIVLSAYLLTNYIFTSLGEAIGV